MQREVTMTMGTAEDKCVQGSLQITRKRTRENKRMKSRSTGGDKRTTSGLSSNLSNLNAFGQISFFLMKFVEFEKKKVEWKRTVFSLNRLWIK